MGPLMYKDLPMTKTLLILEKICESCNQFHCKMDEFWRSEHDWSLVYSFVECSIWRRNLLNWCTAVLQLIPAKYTDLYFYSIMILNANLPACKSVKTAFLYIDLLNNQDSANRRHYAVRSTWRRNFDKLINVLFLICTVKIIYWRLANMDHNPVYS